ncbi:ABC transporter ATP-binding protein [Rhizobium sp. TH135]|uniref:ABC transporter ATP-binding protein n=1 Tax=Rhizobium sp. TH135 TaxID=2067451 RepID=UPI000C7D2946|nr:ABC transporter ATP-binding protein [Rhizobium sp. TH135]PLK68877.1 ABC transporter ATP-binding protein [Rhizobium sp. TH135]
MNKLIKNLATILDAGERRRAILVLITMIVAALLEVAGVASILPFIGVLTDPSLIERNVWLAYAYDGFGFANQRDFLVFLGAVVLVAFISSLVFRALTVYAIQRFALMRIHSIGLRLLRIYMGQPYEFFLNRNSSSLAKSLLSEVATVASSVLMPAMRALSGLIVSTAIVAVLIFVEPAASLLIAIVFVSSYLAVDLLTRKRVRLSGRLRVQANDDQYRIASEAIQGLKELRVLGREADYVERFRTPSRTYSRHQAIMLSTREMPFYVIQAIGFGAMLSFLLWGIARGDDLSRMLPLISFFAFAGYRLLPAFQDVYRSVGQVRFALPALEQLVNDVLMQSVCVAGRQGTVTPLSFERALKFEQVSFRYQGAKEDTLTNFNLSIPARGRIALVGSTGAGKSTVADLVLGLLFSTSGQVTVDGIPLTRDNVRAWQENLGYVPQQIYLSDDTVTANIAFGVPENEVDHASVERAARQAQIFEFVAGLPSGFSTRIGERGARLSGGQRQRLGIARALYRNPSVVVFDEATSALDNQTEAAVMDAIEQLGKEKTVLLVAHRFTSIVSCELICHINQGSVAGFGRYDELLANSDMFRELAEGARML